MTVECRLLGPVEVYLGQRMPNLGHPRQRCVLAALLIDANRVVSVEQLVHRVWDEDPPPAARNALYGYVSRLRRIFTQSDVRLTKKLGGYTIEIDPELVDLHRFRRLVSQARSTTDERAADLFAQALALRSGELLTGVSSDWIENVRCNLEREWMAAVLDRNEVELRQGRHTNLFGQLNELITTHPLDERLVAQLMLATYRSGRQVDALEHYRRTRKKLAEDLGVEASKELQLLHQRILRKDPTLLALAPNSDRARLAAPAELPHDLPGFVGRDTELSALQALIGSGDQVSKVMLTVVIDGMAGVGKTALAIHFAHRVIKEFPNGQLYVDLHGYHPHLPQLPADDALGHFLRALGVDPQCIPPTTQERAALYRTLLAGKRVLIVLDNAAATDQVRPLLPGSPGCLVLVTSRQRLVDLAVRDGAHSITLDVFTPKESLTLLQRSIGVRVRAEPKAAAELARLCGHLPLAVRIAAERAAIHSHDPLKRIVEDLAIECDRLDVLTIPDDKESTTVRAAFSWSYRALSGDVARTLRLLALHPGPDISIPAVAVLIDTAPSGVRRNLDHLTVLHLLEVSGPGRYRLHELVRIYAAEQAMIEESKAARVSVMQRLITWYLRTAVEADSMLDPRRQHVPLDPTEMNVRPLSFSSTNQALDWCEAERANLIAAVHHAAASGWYAIAWKLPLALFGFFYLRKYWPEWLTTCEVGVAAAHKLDEPRAKAWALAGLGFAHYDLRQFAKAIDCLRKSEALAGTIGEPWGHAVTLTGLGACLRDANQHDEALDCLMRALSRWQKIGDRWGEGTALHNLGDTFRRLRQFRKAITFFHEALAVRREIGDRYGEAWTLHDLGAAYQDLHQPDQATHYFHLALTIRRKIGDRHGQARTLRHLGDIHRDIGAVNDAHETWHQALALFKDLGDPRAADVLARLSSSQ